MPKLQSCFVLPRRLVFGWIVFASMISVGAGQTPDLTDQQVRSWKDKSGSYQVEAKLVKLTEKSIDLLKADGRIVSVPTSMLSEQDQEFLRQLLEAPPNPFAGGSRQQAAGMGAETAESEPGDLSILEPSHEPDELPTDGIGIFTESDEDAQPIGPAGAETRPRWKPFVKGMFKYDAYTRRSPPVLLDSEKLTFATSAHRIGNAVSDETFGRVFVYREGKRNDDLVLDLPHTLRIFDHHIPTDTTLACVHIEAGTERGGDLVLLRGIAAGRPSAARRWRLPEWNKPGFKPKVEYARFIDATHAVVQVNDTVYVWDLNQGKCAAKIERVQSGGKIQLSANGRYLALPVTRGCRLIDLESKELVGIYPFKKLTPEVRFSPDGTRLALVAGTQADVWDLQSATKIHEIALSGHCGKFQGWIGNTHLLLDHVGLLDLELGVAIWSYYLPSQVPLLVLDEGVVTMDLNSKSAIYSLPVPHPQAISSRKKLTTQGRMMAVRPGSEVAVEIESTENVDTAALREGLTQSLEANGWKVSRSAKVKVVAKISRGEKQTLHFRYLLASPLSEPEKVRIRPFIASIEIRQGSQVLWSRSASNMVPSLIRLEEGQSLKQAVKQYEKADPSFFSRLIIPAQILSPEAAANIGRSRNVNGKWSDF